MSIVDVSDKRLAHLETKKCFECANFIRKRNKQGFNYHRCTIDGCTIKTNDHACILFKEGEKSEAI